MKFRQLVNPHSHSHYSLDGAATVKQIIKRNLDLGVPYVSLTEHGNINSAMELYTIAKSMNAKPILGIEAYIEHPFQDFLRKIYEAQIEESDPVKKANKVQKKMDSTYMHLTIHFKDQWAYQYFCRLTPIMESRVIMKWGERKCIMTWEEFAGAKGHITATSSCISGPVQSLFHTRWKESYPDLAEKAYCMIRDAVGPENFFVEIFPHKMTHNWQRPEKDKTGKITTSGKFVEEGCSHMVKDGDIQQFTNRFMIKLARQYGDRMLISLDSHFAYPNQKVTQDARLGNGMEAWKFHQNYYIMTTDECAAELKHTLGLTERDIEEMVDNSYAFGALFDNFKIDTSKERWVLNSLPENWMTHLKAAIDRHGRMNWADPAMVDRLKHEIAVLTKNGKINLMPYFFTVEDMANFCRENHILMNVRGSAGGSLLFYILGVSAVNPLKHDLSFGRFLTPGRILANTLPDADLDISTDGRDRLLQYLEGKYKDGFCRISTDALLKLKSSIKDAERATFGVVQPATEALCKALPMEPQGSNSKDIVFGTTDKSGNHTPGLLETHEGLKNYAATYPAQWQLVTEMLGVMRQKGAHACGVVIAEEPIQNFCPIMYLNDTRLTGFSPKSVEAAGLVKYDLLGLNTLQDIEKCLTSIKDRLKLTINPWEAPEELDVFQELWSGNTVGVFQFDTDTVRPYLVNIKPRSRDDLAAITSLCRPGCLDAPYHDGRTLAQVYVARCQGETIEYVHPDLESIFKETMGIALYQEQTISVFKKLANYSDEQAETVRRGIGKKDEKVLASCIADLKAGCMSRGWTESQVKLLVDQIMASARYAFNKSHAISYAYVAYACAYLKKRYPLDWWKAVLSNASKDEVAAKFWPHVSSFTVLPDINISGNEFNIIDDKIVAPLSIVNGIGEKAFGQIVGKRPYLNLMDYVQKHHLKSAKNGSRSAVHSGISRKLIAGGVIDSIFGKLKDMTIEYKLEAFEKAKSLVRNDRQKPIPEEFVGITGLGKYLIKKELISIYSEDLRPIMLPKRGCTYTNGKWTTQNGIQVLGGLEFDLLKKEVAEGFVKGGNYAILAYVVQERTFTYKNKSKQATELILDINGVFSKEVFWPPYQENVAPSGFSKRPVLVYLNIWKGRIGISGVQSLIDTASIGKYNVI